MRPAWHVIEGIVARDGTGFNRGKNVPLGLVLAGCNPFAVDYVGAYLMGFAPEEVGFLRAAVARLYPGADVQAAFLSADGRVTRV